MMTSRRLCERLGISYRQLDYACRLGLIHDTATGSGSRRHFDADTVARLTIAAQVKAAADRLFYDGMAWPTAVASVMNSPMPARRGYAVVIGHGLATFHDDADLADLCGRHGAVLVVPYDVDAAPEAVAA